MTTVVTGASVVPHYIITTLRNCDRWICLVIASIGPHILLLELITVDVDCTCTHLDCIPWKANYPFDKRLFPILRIPEHHYVMAFYLAETIEELIDKNALLIHQMRLHASSFYTHRLDYKNNN